MRIKIKIGLCTVCLEEFTRDKFHLNKKGNLIERVCGPCRIKRFVGDKTEYRKFKSDKCGLCGFSGHPCQLDVDHIDGDHNNNEPKNLQTLCANCHRLKTHQSRLDKRAARAIIV